MQLSKAHQKAIKFVDKQNYNKALSQYHIALQSEPNNPDLYSQRGVVYLHLKQKKKCFDDLLHALQLQPDYAYRYSSLAYAKDYFGDIDGAIKAYQKAIELDPEDAIAHNNLGLLLEKKGYQNKAQKEFQKADSLMQNEEITNEPIGVPLQPQKLNTNSKQTYHSIIRSIFTNKNTFKEFIRFIRNGFKLKSDEQKRKG